ncbi:MAG: FAD-binding oxidoreductase [Thermoplasmata archaeon]|nr:FAD-binding oxidoreductase [Thermoplasmata archaeon]
MSAGPGATSGIAIVGAGIIGLYTAYHLARAGAGPITVLDRGWLSNGASGRNGGGVRQQWETPATVRLARESVAAYRRFGREFGFNIWFRQGGYLFLAESEPELRHLSGVTSTIRSEGLDGKLLRPEEVPHYAPGLDPGGLVGGSYLHSDGTLYPFPALWALNEAVVREGVNLRMGTEVTGIRTEDARVTGLATSAGPLVASVVVNAAGGWAGDLSALAGLPTPNHATRHEILATEPLKPFLDPMVVRLRDGLYFSQTMRGEIVGGLTMAHPTGTRAGMPSSSAFLRAMSRALVGLLPSIRHLGVLRAWSGFYDDTPDGLPVIGEDPRLRGFFHANGFGGHGFMLAPAASRRVAQAILGERSDLDPGQFSVGRFLTPPADRPVEGLQLG